MATEIWQRTMRSAALSSVYRVVAGGLVVFGLWQMGLDAWISSSGGPGGVESIFRGFGAFIGFGVALVGVVNLLNILYGPGAPGVRATAIGANVILVVLHVWVGGIPADWLGRFVLVLFVFAAGLSMSRKALSPRVANV